MNYNWLKSVHSWDMSVYVIALYDLFIWFVTLVCVKIILNCVNLKKEMMKRAECYSNLIANSISLKVFIIVPKADN